MIHSAAVSFHCGKITLQTHQSAINEQLNKWFLNNKVSLWAIADYIQKQIWRSPHGWLNDLRRHLPAASRFPRMLGAFELHFLVQGCYRGAEDWNHLVSQIMAPRSNIHHHLASAQSEVHQWMGSWCSTSFLKLFCFAMINYNPFPT